jgi:hypothetical protein
MKVRTFAMTFRVISLGVLVTAGGVTFRSAQQVPAGKAAIQGVVVDSSTGKPIPGASIYPLRLGTGDTHSKADGTFRLENLVAGRYAIGVSTLGETTSWWFALTPGQEIRDVVFRQRSAGFVSGRVVDAHGAPVANATVRLLEQRYGLDSGRIWASASGLAASNDNGDFMVAAPPGRYLLQAGPFFDRSQYGGVGPVLDPNQPPPKMVIPDIGIALYPGVHDPAKATFVEVRSGEKVDLGAFPLTPSDKGRIRLHLSEFQLGAVTATFNEIYWGRAGWLYESTDPRVLEYRPDVFGTFEVFLEHQAFGTMIVDFDGNDVELRPDSSTFASATEQFSVRFFVEPADGGPVRRLTSGAVSILVRSPRDPDRCWGHTAPLDSDGLLRWMESAAGNSRPIRLCRVSAGIRDVHVESARQGTRDVLTEGIVRNPAVPVDIVFSAGSGTLQGLVKNRDATPVHNAVIALIPAPPLSNRSDMQTTYVLGNSDQNGFFEIAGIVPGPYRAYAWSPDEAIWHDVVRLNLDDARRSLFNNRSRSVEIGKGQRVSADLQVP